ncbi:MAG TPA: DinB family protein [Candidatus Dormibacteraeota bacterium]|nr:DinB family protein [Candidatus Dormibacteraeota bacterium]
MSPVIDYFRGWADHNKLLVKTIAPLGDEDLLLSAGEGLWNVRMLACHIVAARAWWFGSWMGEGDDELRRLVTMDDDSEAERPDATKICNALEKSWGDVCACLEKWTADDLDAKFQRPKPNAAGERPWRDRRFILWHVAEHDVHHGGEISLTLGMHGRPGLDM